MSSFRRGSSNSNSRGSSRGRAGSSFSSSRGRDGSSSSGRGRGGFHRGGSNASSATSHNSHSSSTDDRSQKKWRMSDEFIPEDDRARIRKSHNSDSSRDEPLLAPIFADIDLGLADATKKTGAKASEVKIITPVNNSRLMKATAPIVRSAANTATAANNSAPALTAAATVVDLSQQLKQVDRVHATEVADTAALSKSKRSSSSSTAAATAAATDGIVTLPTSVTAAKAALETMSTKALFASTAADVQSLGATGLDKWTLARHRATEDAKLGLKPLKAAKMPLPMYLGMQAKQSQREKRKRESDREQGLAVRSESSFTQEAKRRKLEKEKEADVAAGGWRMNIGSSHRDGVLQLRRSEIAQLTSRGRGRGRGGRGRGR